jgi:hypothetical protein
VNPSGTEQDWPEPDADPYARYFDIGPDFENVASEDGWPDEPTQEIGGAYDPVADSKKLAPEILRNQRFRYADDLVKRQRLEQEWRPIEDQGNLAQQLQAVIADPLFLVEELFPDGMICQINAQFKIGKTTLVINLVQSLSTGEPFLRRFPVHSEFKGHIAHWNMEVDQKTLLGWYRKQALPDHARARVFPLSVRGNISLDFMSDVVMDWTIKWLQNNNIKVWIIDPLSKLFRDDENSNYEFNQWWLRLEHIVREAGVRLAVIVHHTGHSGERARGASAMMGNPDVLLSYTHSGKLGEVPPNTRRYLSGLGRGVELSSTEIDFDRETSALFCTDSGTTRIQAKSHIKARQAGVAVWNAHAPINTGDLYKVLGWQQSGTELRDNKTALERAEDKGYIVRQKQGRTTWNSPGTVDPRTDEDGSK